MSAEEDKKERLRRQFDQVNARLQLLDMMDERLKTMKMLAKRVAEEDLTDAEIKQINRQVQALAKEVELLDTVPREYYL